MKKSILCMMIMLCVVFTAFAQTLQIEDTINITRERWRDTCFGLINRDATQISSGYLVDYSLGIIDKDFDGVGNNDTIKAYGDFFYYYNILELSKVNSNGALQLTDDLFINAKRYKRDNTSFPLLFMFQPYEKINVDALNNNLYSLTADSVRLMDVPNRTSSPYDNKEIFIFTPVQTNIKQYGNISFSLPSSFWQMPGINSVSIDFNDGLGFRTIAKDGTTSVYYATEGYKNITVVITTANGSRTAKCRINYARPEFYLQPDTSWNVSVTPVYTDESSYLGGSRTSRITDICNAGTVFDRVNCDIGPGANVRVINGCDQIFDRPIIIVEGFDTDNGLDIDELFRRFSRYDFIDNMRSAGHDFVFVNLKKPLDFIENNAKVLEEVINQVNITKVGNARGSVIGFSMGGLVARWCLKDMEDRSIDHEMAHYFSYDSPHQGANIPLGLQYLFGEMENDLSWLKWKNWGGSPVFPPFYQLVAAAHSAAARQILVTKGNYTNGPFNWNPTLNTLDPIRSAFAQRLVQKGYPQNLTRHAIAFGRGNNPVSTKTAGNGNQFGNFVPSSKIFDGNIFFSLVNLTSSAFAVPENNTNDYICRYRFLGIKVVGLFNINIVPVSSFRVRNFRYTGQYPYDDAPGSYETTQTQFVERFNQFNGLAANATNLSHHGHNFVSTVSALDLLNQGYSSSTSWQSNNLFFNADNSITNPGQVAGNTIASTLSPFNDVLTYTSDCGIIGCQSFNDDIDGNGFPDVRNNDWNQYHNGFISNQASNYIQRKILNTAPGGCPSLCNTNNNISGPALICTNEIYQLTGPNPAGLNILWESENGFFQVTAGQGTTQMTAIKNFSGNDFIRVTLTNGCGSIRVIRIPVHLGGYSSSDYPVSGPSSACRNTYVYFSTNTLPGATDYAWFWPATNWTYVSGNHTPNLTLITGTSSGTVGVRVANACDAGGSPGMKFVQVNNCGGFSFTASPNPNTGSVNIAVVPQVSVSGNENENKIYKLKVIDQAGNIKKQFNYPSGVTSAIINISNLNQGIYILHAYNGSIWSSRQIFKE